MENSNQKKAYISAFLYALIIGFSFLFVKLSIGATNPLNVLAHRFTIAFISILIPVLFGWIKLNIRFKDFFALLPIALFYPTLFFAFQTFGLVYMPSSEAGIVQATTPIFTMILAALFLREKSNIKQKLCLILSVFGVVFIFLMKGTNIQSSNVTGIVLMLLTALSFSSYNVIARKVTKNYKIMDLTFMMTTLAFIAFNILSIGDFAIKGDLTHYFSAFTDFKFVISVVYLGTLSSVISSLLSNYALTNLEASKFSVFNNLSTLMTMVIGSVFLHEQLYWYHIVGAIMILLGVLGTNFLGSTKKKEDTDTLKVNVEAS